MTTIITTFKTLTHVLMLIGQGLGKRLVPSKCGSGFISSLFEEVHVLSFRANEIMRNAVNM